MAFLTLFSAIDHRTWNTGLPVRSAVLKPCAGRLVVGWVTTSESLLLIVLHFLLLLQQSPLAGIPQRLSSPQPSYLRVTVTWRLLWLPIPDVAGNLPKFPEEDTIFMAEARTGKAERDGFGFWSY